MALYHKHALLRLECDPANLVDLTLEQLEQMMLTIVEKVNMKVLMGPFITYCDTEGNVGWTGATVIETSHLTFHAWEETGLVQADLYSCSDFEPQSVVDEFSLLFKPHYVEILTVDRNSKESMADAPNWRSWPRTY